MNLSFASIRVTTYIQYIASGIGKQWAMQLNSENQFKQFARDPENQTDTFEGNVEINNSEWWKFLMSMNLVSHHGELIPEMAIYQKAS